MRVPFQPASGRAAGLALALLLAACAGGDGPDRPTGGSGSGTDSGSGSGSGGGDSGGGSGGDSDGGDAVPFTPRSVDADFHTRRTPALAAGEFELITLSSLPDMVTGGDALVALRGLAAGDAWTVTRNGADVSDAFARQPGGEVRALVTGLVEGNNLLIADVVGAAGARRAQLGLRNHPVTGPVISGPHQTPFVCRTEASGLGPALDANCSVETRFQWFYRSATNQQFAELEDPFAAYPDDVLSTTLRDGRVVPYVVRVESATLNRGIARIAVLDDPAARGAGAAFAPNWNRRVYYVFGESCGVGYQQGVNDAGIVLGGVPEGVAADRALVNLVGIDQRLGQGDVIVHNTLSAFGVHCNPLVSVETVSIVKEHIAENYGDIESVLGTNGSGAALQQYNAINNAPGLLSAGMPTATFADIVSTAMTVADCGLLQNYYTRSELDWTDAKRAAVNGHNLLSGNTLNAICQSWSDAFLSRIDATEGCDGSIPREMRYDAATNPTGVRCTLQDGNVNIYGRDPATGFARRPLDNSGVQYGLDALNAGQIEVAEFLDLNRQIGGFDIDGDIVPTRMVMDAEVEALTYRIGGVIGRGALAQTPVMDIAPYLDLIPVLNIHEAVRPFTVRARLRERSGQIATQSIWRGVLTQPDAFTVMDPWLEATLAARPPHGGDHVAAVIAAKPTGAADRCTFGTLGGRLEFPDAVFGPLGIQAPLLNTLPAVSELFPDFDVDVPLRVDVPEDFDSGLGPCSVALPVTRTPRMVAGMPLSDDVIKCQLKPVDAADYAVAMSPADLDALRAIFPGGVCDWSKPAAGDVERSLIWPSVGGENLQAPAGLTYRVGRSSPIGS